MTYSNPTLRKEIDDYPSGGARVKCVFEVEHNKNGYRVIRTTQRHGQWCKPKLDTYGDRTVIVTGDNGQTFILQEKKFYQMVTVKDHAFMHVFTSHESSDPVRYKELLAIIESAY